MHWTLKHWDKKLEPVRFFFSSTVKSPSPWLPNMTPSPPWSTLCSSKMSWHSTVLHYIKCEQTFFYVYHQMFLPRSTSYITLNMRHICLIFSITRHSRSEIKSWVTRVSISTNFTDVTLVSKATYGECTFVTQVIEETGFASLQW